MNETSRISGPVLLKIRHNGKIREYFTSAEKDLHTDIGLIKAEELKKKRFGEIVASHLGHEFLVQRPRSPDFYRHATRTGMPMSPKDIGVIIANVGLCSNDTVLDAGTGSGILTIYLGSIAKRVVTYEVRPDFVEVARKNVLMAGMDNIEIRNGDILEEIRHIDEKFDVLTLDLPDTAIAVPYVPRVLNPGGYLVTYSPFFEQTKEIRLAIDKGSFSDVRTIECMEREISFGPRGTRPSTMSVGHTGFITIARI